MAGRSLWLTGAIAKISDREEIINRFNTSPDLPVLFLTTGVGGVGITLTGADRVIIYDPSWNPATDAQAVDRAFRVGQVSAPYSIALHPNTEGGCATRQDRVLVRRCTRQAQVRRRWTMLTI